ncbi:hypothetical protein D3C75_186840 [compost metagenome]
MMDLSNVDIEKVIAAIEKEAHNLAQDAGYAGEMGDGGAGRLREQVKWFSYGMIYANKKEFPQEWNKYAEKIAREADPEWAELQRLMGKFNIKSR